MNIVVFSQTMGYSIGQINASIFQNCPLQLHDDPKKIKIEKVSQKWLKK
jgi:hypothetical protein